jgi:broad specificity phosphatase PhoE
MEIFLVRHGQSVANVAGKVTGTTNDPLTELGRQQVSRLSEVFCRYGWLDFDGYFCSHWRRAQESLQILFSGSTFSVDPRLGETDAGEVADWQLSLFLEARPDFYTDPALTYPGGESHLMLNDRVLGWFAECSVKVSNRKRLLVVSHSGPICCLLQHALNMGMDSFPALLPGHASLTILEVCADSLVRPRIKTFSMLPPPLESLSWSTIREVSQ